MEILNERSEKMKCVIFIVCKGNIKKTSARIVKCRQLYNN